MPNLFSSRTLPAAVFLLLVAGELPRITYTSGGLENAAIRKLVCDILEGGEHAFKERARRLRVRLSR